MEKEFSDESRIANSKKNIKVATILQLSAATLGFVERAFFINYLSSELLGLKGLIMSILMVLTITEYGISSSLAFYLYKPLVNKNYDKINSIIKFIRKVYNSLTLTVLVFGLALLPIFPTIANTSDIAANTLRLYFLIYLIGTTMSLKFAYHAIIIQADQKQYITTLYVTGANIVQLFLQIAVLVLTQNFYLYALMYAIANGSKFLFVRCSAKRQYSFLKARKKTIKKLPKEVLNQIKKETRVLIFHKLGFSVTMIIECVLLSYFLGAATLGIFTNYQLVILGIATGMAFFQKSFESSIGNLCTMESEKKAYEWFLKINHVYSLGLGYMCALLISMFNPFFNLFYPKADTFNYFTTLLITLTQYFYYKRLIVTIYESSYGIFYQDRYKPFVQTGLSAVLAALLGMEFGAKGIFGAIVLSELFTSTWIEPYMVFKHGFKTTQKLYWIDYIKNMCIVGATAAVTYFAVHAFEMNAIVKLLASFAVTTLSYLILLSIFFPKNGKSIINWVTKKNAKNPSFNNWVNIEDNNENK
ncbi:MAG: lipopolysaccharide biosynthesis protein [Sphaerochaeta sp.]